MWEDYRDFFEPDSNLTNVCVRAGGASSWNVLLEIVRKHDGKFTIEEKASPYLTFDWDGLKVNAHLSDEDNLEITIDPREINSQKTLDSFAAFVRLLTQATGKPALVTPENSPYMPFLEFSPENTEVKTVWGGKWGT